MNAVTKLGSYSSLNGQEDDSGGAHPADKRKKPTGSALRRKQPLREKLQAGMGICRSAMWTVALFSIAINFLMLTLPLYLFQITDRVMASGSHDTLVMLSVVAVGALAVLALLNIARRLLLTRIGVRFETLLGGTLLGAGLKGVGTDATQSLQRIQDLSVVRNFVCGPVMLNIFDAGMAPLYFATVFMIHPDLGWIVLLGGSVLLFVAITNQRVTESSLSAANAHSVRAFMQAQAHARNAQVVRAMGMAEDSVRIWGQDHGSSLKAQVMASDRNVYLAGFSQFVRLAMQIGLLGWGAYLVLGAELTGGMMIAASIVGSKALSPVEGAIDGWRSFMAMRSASRRIKQSIATGINEPDHMIMPDAKGELSVENLHFVAQPGGQAILKGVSFSVEPGVRLAIIGASGAGKSTLARLLVGSLLPAAGTVRLDGTPLQHWDPRQLGRSIGYLPQEVELFPGTIRDNICRMRPDADDEDITRAAELAGAHDMICRFEKGYMTEIGMDGQPLSGGQRQRVGLARAYFGDPAVVVLDEPNSNLDGVGEQALADALHKAQQRSITTIIVTQRPAVLQNVDQILVIDNGQVAAFGKREDVLPMVARSETPAACKTDEQPASAPLLN
jgi:ATP-binding cassette subfamily C protein